MVSGHLRNIIVLISALFGWMGGVLMKITTILIANFIGDVLQELNIKKTGASFDDLTAMWDSQNLGDTSISSL